MTVPLAVVLFTAWATPRAHASKTKQRQGVPIKSKLAVLFAIVLPTLVTWVYFVLLKDSPASVQQTAYSIGKTVQFVFPIVWVWFVDPQFFRSKTRPAASRKRLGLSREMWLGIAFSDLVVAAMFVIFFVFLQSTDIASALVEQVRAKTVRIGIDTTFKFLLLGVFYSLCHSFLEEYYWRWFVFGYLRKYLPVTPSILISSACFMAHHVILLGVFFGAASPLTYLFSIAVGIGGAFWAWLYQATGSLRAAWISHLIVDAGIFTLGYFLIRPFLAG
jgi:membrane protease YdiL (CAAX protease family)